MASPASPARAADPAEKPVGTVCISVSSATDAEERTVRLPGRPRRHPRSHHHGHSHAPPRCCAHDRDVDSSRPADRDLARPHSARRGGGAGDLRLFVALDLPDAVRDALAALGAAADQDSGAPSRPRRCTSRSPFSASRPPEDVEAIAPVVPPSARRRRLALGDILLLPPRRARVLTVALADPTGALAGLQARIATALTGT